MGDIIATSTQNRPSVHSECQGGLEPGSRLQLGWLPDRLITVTYIGHNRFVVEVSLNSSLQPGDSFECLQIQVGRPLYLDRFRRAGSTAESRYVAGDRHGLTSVKAL